MTDLAVFFPSLIASASGAAVVAGCFGIYTRTATKKDERDKWLRDQKLDTYSQYLDATDSMAHAVSSHRVAMLSQEDLIKKFGESQGGKLDILAPEALRTAAQELHTMLSQLRDDARNPRVFSVEGEAAYATEFEALMVQRSEVIRLMQQDLKVEKVRYAVSGSLLCS